MVFFVAAEESAKSTCEHTSDCVGQLSCIDGRCWTLLAVESSEQQEPPSIYPRTFLTSLQWFNFCSEKSALAICLAVDCVVVCTKDRVFFTSWIPPVVYKTWCQMPVRSSVWSYRPQLRRTEMEFLGGGGCTGPRVRLQRRRPKIRGSKTLVYVQETFGAHETHHAFGPTRISRCRYCYGSSLQCSCKGVSIATLDKGCVTLTTVEVWPWSLVWLQLIDHEPQVVAGKYIRLLTTTAMKPWLTWSGISPNCSVNWSNNTAPCATCIHPHERKREITFCCSQQPSPTPVQIRAWRRYAWWCCAWCLISSAAYGRCWQQQTWSQTPCSPTGIQELCYQFPRGLCSYQSRWWYRYGWMWQTPPCPGWR